MPSPAEKKRRTDGKQSKEQKKRKWEAKQLKKRQEQELQDARAVWLKEHSHFAHSVTPQHVEAIQNATSSQNMDSSQLKELLLPYFNIQDKSTTDSGRSRHMFIAEGTETIRILIRQHQRSRRDGLQPIQLQSIFVKPNLLFEEPVRLLTDVMGVPTAQEEKTKRQHPGFDVLVGSEAALSKVAGFPVSRGALACGFIPNDHNSTWLEKLLQERLSKVGTQQIRLLAMDGICDTSNLGSMIRCASAFGIDAIVLSHDTCDAWYRRSIRVSMGHIFRVPVVRVENLAATLCQWSEAYPQLRSYAAVIDTDSLLESIPKGEVPASWCCVVGNEGQGISSTVADACSQRLRIGMNDDVDSLSVPIACGILLHGLKEREGK